MKKLLIVCILLLFATYTNMFASNIVGILIDANNQPINGATVSLTTQHSGQMVAQTITSDNGYFEFHDINSGDYTLRCSFIGFITYQAELHVVDGKDLNIGSVVMSVSNVEVGEVEVFASRNVFNVDKQIIYPSERQINASSSGLDLLQKQHIPFVEVDAKSQTNRSILLVVQFYI